jgi:hypothetical protein
MKINLFLPWYSWKIAELALKTITHSLNIWINKYLSCNISFLWRFVGRKNGLRCSENWQKHSLVLAQDQRVSTISFAPTGKNYYNIYSLQKKQYRIFVHKKKYDGVLYDRILSWSWSYGSWIYNNMCNQCLSPITLWVRILLMVRYTQYNIMW